MDKSDNKMNSFQQVQQESFHWLISSFTVFKYKSTLVIVSYFFFTLYVFILISNNKACKLSKTILVKYDKLRSYWK